MNKLITNNIFDDIKNANSKKEKLLTNGFNEYIIEIKNSITISVPATNATEAIDICVSVYNDIFGGFDKTDCRIIEPY